MGGDQFELELIGICNLGFRVTKPKEESAKYDNGEYNRQDTVHDGLVRSA